MNTPQFPIDYNLIRKTICNEVQKITGIPCILQEPETPVDLRPKLPYFSLKFVMPGQKRGDDAYSTATGDPNNPSSEWAFGGTRRITAQFDCYATTHEQAYSYMALWQGSLDTIPVQQDLREIGLAVWQILDNTDSTALLNTGFEGRALLEVYFGIVSNLVKDLGSMEHFPIKGEIFSDSGTDTVNYTVTED